jgi:ABC-type Mn2+/Zn2+ transport system permease subunit
MKNQTPGVVLLIVGALSLLSGLSARVWRDEGTRYRLIAAIFGLICVALGVLGLLGYIDINE